jgi:L-iditol 2-dehydrogenase
MAKAAKMKGVFLVEAGKFETRDMPMPRPGPRDVLVAVKSCGICGSDMHFYEHGRIGDFVVKAPLVLGHEAAGEVVEVGAEVKSLRAGDRVAIEPGIPCRHCAHCLGGRYNLCHDVVFMSAPPHHGFFREYVALPEDFAYKLPENVSIEAGATVEPLAVGIHAASLVGLRAGETAVVLGAGPIGLVTVAAARAFGATDITAVDLIPMRLDAARGMGASRTVNAQEENVSEALRDSADVVLDCVAVAETFQQAFDIIKPGGRVAWVGMASDIAQVPFQTLQVKEALVTGVFRYANRFGTAVSLLSAGMIDTAPIITHRFRFPDVAEAMRFAVGNRALALKTIVTFD